MGLKKKIRAANMFLEQYMLEVKQLLILKEQEEKEFGHITEPTQFKINALKTKIQKANKLRDI